MSGSTTTQIPRKINKVGIFSGIVAVAVYALIWVVMILYVEWDGSKPGGWGYFWVPFLTFCIFAPGSAFISYWITYGITSGVVGLFKKKQV